MIANNYNYTGLCILNANQSTVEKLDWRLLEYKRIQSSAIDPMHERMRSFYGIQVRVYNYYYYYYHANDN